MVRLEIGSNEWRKIKLAKLPIDDTNLWGNLPAIRINLANYINYVHKCITKLLTKGSTGRPHIKMFAVLSSRYEKEKRRA